MSRGPDAGTLLTRALVADAARTGCAIAITDSDWVRWSSATFSGARHRLTLSGAAGAALDTFLDALPEHEFVLRGQIVADVTVAAVRQAEGVATVTIEALTVEVS